MDSNNWRTFCIFCSNGNCANDVANAYATAVDQKFYNAPGCQSAAICETSGAILMGIAL